MTISKKTRRFELFRKFGQYFFMVLFLITICLQSYEFLMYRNSYTLSTILGFGFFTLYFRHFYGIEALLKRFDKLDKEAREEALKD